MRVISLLSMLVFVAACSRLTNVDGLGVPAPPSAPTLIELDPEVPRFGEAVTATASGSVDPGGTELRYRFEWVREGSPVQEDQRRTLQDTLISELRKGEQWVVRVTPVSADDRVGDPAERAFTIGNTAPTLQTVGLNLYRPITTDVVRAFPEGYHDVDGDAPAFRYIWHVGTREPIETTQSELDLSSLATPPNPETDELSLDVIPSDGEDDNAPLSLGPFRLIPDVTRWRALQPTRLLDGGDEMGDFVAYDKRHRRFLVSASGSINSTGLNFEWSSLWEYQTSGGWALLEPYGSPPDLKSIKTAYDGMPGAERLLVAGYNESNQFEVHALALHDRGLERWTKLAVPTGPPLRSLYTLFYDTDTKVLMVQGGLLGLFLVTDELWLLDFRGETPEWVEGSPFSTFEPAAGATAVSDPTEDNTLLFFGGLTNDGAASIRRLKYDFSDPENASYVFTRLDKTLFERPLGVIAVADPERRVVVGGLGVAVDFGGNEPVEGVFVYYPAEGRLDYQDTGLFGELAAEAGSMYGVAAWEDGRALFWPGRTQEFDSRWRLGEIVPIDGPDPYEWRTLVLEGTHYPESLTQVTSDQGRTFALTGAESPEAFFYDRSSNHWTAISPPGESPGPITDVVNGAGETVETVDGLWTLDGMTPWYVSEDGWETMPVLEPLPAGGIRRAAFDPGCGPTTPIGVVGKNVSELLQCPAGASECQWNPVSGIDVANAPIHTAYDGQQYVLAIHRWEDGGRQHPDREISYWRFDVCNDAESGWRPFEITDDPVHGNLFSDGILGTKPSIDRMSDDKRVFIVLRQGFGMNPVWRLTHQTGDDSYQWHFIEAEGAGPIPNKWAVSHWNEETQSLLHFDVSRAEVWELRVRGEDLP